MFAWLFKRQRQPVSYPKPPAEPIVAVEPRPAPQCRPELPPYPVCLRWSANRHDFDIADGHGEEAAADRHADRMAAVVAAAGESPDFGDPEADHAQQWLRERIIYWNNA